MPALVFAIGEWHENFEQLEDAEVRQPLDQSRKAVPAAVIGDSESG
jgi:predicted phosphoribosyltransferase